MKQQSSIELGSTFKDRIKNIKMVLELRDCTRTYPHCSVFISYKVVDILLHHPRDTNVSYELNMDRTPYEIVDFKSLKMIIR